jgi:hypothetical protein
MKIRYAISFITALLLGVPFYNAAAQSDWTLKKKQSGIEIFVRDAAGSSFKEFRGIMNLSNVKLGSLLAVFDDTASYTRWMHNCTEAKLLKIISPFERITYSVTHAPWPVWDRDIVSHSLISQDPKTLAVSIRITGKADYLQPVEKRIRVPMMEGLWLLKPLESGDIMVFYQMHSEPGGELPAGLSNMASVDLPYYTLMKLRDIVKENKYANVLYPILIEPKPTNKGDGR